MKFKKQLETVYLFVEDYARDINTDIAAYFYTREKNAFFSYSSWLFLSGGISPVGRVVMRHRTFPVIFLGIALTVFFGSLALAEVPVDGWGMVKFGMTPEEVRRAYEEEQEEHAATYEERMEYIERTYADDPEELERQREWMQNNMKDFWYEITQEDVPGVPHQLFTLRLQPILSLDELGVWSTDFFYFGENGLYETKTMICLPEAQPFFLPELLEEEEIASTIDRADELSEELKKKLYGLFGLTQEVWGDGEEVEEDGEHWWVWRDLDDNSIRYHISAIPFNHKGKQYTLYSGLTIIGSGPRAAATYTALRKYVNEPCEPEELFDRAWEKYTTEVWGTPRPATAEDAASAMLRGEPVPPVPHKYNEWTKSMETITYNQVPDFDKPLAAFLTFGGRTIRSLGSPNEVEKMMDVPTIRANRRLETLLGLPEGDLEDWDAQNFKNRSFSAKFATYIELTETVLVSEEFKDFVFKDWLYGDLRQPETEEEVSK